MNISKEEILEMSHGGLDFYRLVIPDLQVISEKKCKSTYNPFYQDGKPGFSIYFKDEKWRFYDHGEPEYHGDVFIFAGLYYGLDSNTQFVELLERMYEDLTKATEEGTIIIAEPEIKTSLAVEPVQHTPNKSFTLMERPFTQPELNYFAKFGITVDILKEYRVAALNSYTTINASGNRNTFHKPRFQMMFAYKGNGFAKIYVPIPKSFYWVGQKPDNYIFGWNQIEQGDGHNFVLDYVIITGGEKDVMTLRSLGYYNVISLNSETASIDAKFAESLNYHTFNRVAVLYDLDETGQKASRELADKFGFRQVILPESLKLAGGKDVSDYVALKLDIDQLKALIQPAIDEDEGEPPGQEEEEEPPQNEEENEKSGNLSAGAPPDDSDLYDPMPYLPEDIYNELPDILKESCELFDDRRQKDLYLLSAFSVLSGCFPMIRGVYDDDETACNIYSMIVAPPASGKGAMKWAIKLANKVSEYIKEDYKDMRRRIKAANERREAGKESEGEKVDDIEKVRRTLYLSANISFAALIDLMDDNDGYGIIFDSEADVVNRMFITEWGQYSTVLRQAFHSEPISHIRMTAYIEIEFPVLSVALSGTKDQLINLIKEVDNGLFSRIMFYQFYNMAVWRDPWRHNNSMREKFLGFAHRVLAFYMELPERITFELEPDQKSEFNACFEQWTEEINRERKGEGIEILFRIGIITYRIAMLLTLLRQENIESAKNSLTKVVCDLKDLYIALKIAETLKVHSYEIYNELAGYPSRVLSFGKDIREYYHELPDFFTRKEADAFAMKLNVKLSTAEKWLKKFIEEKLIERTRYGQYSKIKIHRK